LTRLATLCEQPWFHGSITTEEAEKRIVTNQPCAEGLFLIRLSQHPQSCFSISKVKSGKIGHQRIMRDKETGKYLVLVDENVEEFKTLIELVSKKKEQLSLLLACEESRDFAIVFAKQTSHLQSQGYMDAGTLKSIGYTDAVNVKPIEKTEPKKKPLGGSAKKPKKKKEPSSGKGKGKKGKD